MAFKTFLVDIFIEEISPHNILSMKRVLQKHFFREVDIGCLESFGLTINPKEQTCEKKRE